MKDYSTYPTDYYNEYVDIFCKKYNISKRDENRLYGIRASQRTIEVINDEIKQHLHSEHGIKICDCLEGNENLTSEELMIFNCCTLVARYKEIINQAEVDIRDNRIELGLIFTEFQKFFE
jgi:hypothetical protein